MWSAEYGGSVDCPSVRGQTHSLFRTSSASEFFRGFRGLHVFGMESDCPSIHLGGGGRAGPTTLGFGQARDCGIYRAKITRSSVHGWRRVVVDEDDVDRDEEVEERPRTTLSDTTSGGGQNHGGGGPRTTRTSSDAHAQEHVGGCMCIAGRSACWGLVHMHKNMRKKKDSHRCSDRMMMLRYYRVRVF